MSNELNKNGSLYLDTLYDNAKKSKTVNVGLTEKMLIFPVKIVFAFYCTFSHCKIFSNLDLRVGLALLRKILKFDLLSKSVEFYQP